MLVVEQVAKNYGDVQALDGVDLRCEEGEIVALLGRNGAGKSTLLSIVAGLLRPDSGRVTVGGLDVRQHSVKTARLTGLAPQETGVYRALTVDQNLRFFAELAGVSRSDAGDRVQSVAGQLGLIPLLERRAAQLSGGELRRLHAGCALVHEPSLLLLDEPTVGADVGTRNELIASVIRQAEAGAAVVYTTHYLPEVVALGARIVIIDHGKVVDAGSRQELVARYRLEGLEVSFRHPPPDRIFDGWTVEPIGDGRYRLTGGAALADLVARLGDDVGDLREVATLEPDLETVFLAATGQRIDDDTGEDAP